MNITVKNLFLCLSMLSAALLVASSAEAQKNDPPSGQAAIGIYATTIGLSGVDFTYAVNPNIQVGSLFSLYATSGNFTGGTQFLIGPFFRYLVSGSVSPFLEGGFLVKGISVTSTTLVEGTPTTTTVSSTNTSLFLGAGFSYYINHEVGVHASVLPLVLGLNPSGSIIGVNSLIIGADWFF